MNDQSVNNEDQVQIEPFSMQYKNSGNNVSSFYQDDIQESSDLSIEEEAKESKPLDAQPLRIPNHIGQSGSTSDMRAKETEISQPIMHLMQIHQ